MLSKILLTPFILGALVFLYLAWEVDPDWSYYLIPCAVGAALVYVLSPQIDWWWYKRRPPELPTGLQTMFETRFDWYKQLPEPLRKRFRERTALYMKAHDFKAQGMETMPADVQAVIAATAVQISFGHQDFLMEPYEHIIVYPHPFPSPQYPDKWHTSELYDDDGVLIFSAQHLMLGFFKPRQYFHIALYEYARVFRRVHPEKPWPQWQESDWDTLQTISGMRREAIVKWIGLPDIDIDAVAVVHFFVFPERFQRFLPERFATLRDIFFPRQNVQQSSEG